MKTDPRDRAIETETTSGKVPSRHEHETMVSTVLTPEQYSSVEIFDLIRTFVCTLQSLSEDI